VYFCTLCPSIGPKEKSRQVLGWLPLVSNFLTNFWMEHFDGARLSPNSFRNAVWHALNEPVCQYLRTRNLLCSTVYIFTHATFDSQLPRCGNAQHRQMQVTGSVQIARRSRYVYINFQVIISITSFFIDNSLGPLVKDSPCITILTVVLQLSTVFSTVTCCTGLYPRSNRLYHIA